MYENFAILAAFVFLYSLTGARLGRTPISGAIIFAFFGLIFGPLGLGLLNLEIDTDGLGMLAELTLALVLFTDASKANFRVLQHSFRFPLRLLLIGLPLTIFLGWCAGLLLLDGLTLFEAAILATMLAPTDAALGKAVVSNTSVPSNIREAMNVESGLNDGICVPILFIFLALATDSGLGNGAGMIGLTLVAQSVGIGLLAGIGLTYLGVNLSEYCVGRGWVSEAWQQLPVPALAVTCFATVQWMGGSGFIACFAGGLLFGYLEKQHKHRLLLAAEGTGDTMALLTWVVFGSVVIGRSEGTLTWEVLLYAVLSLTVIRMVPVLLALIGLKLRTDERFFMAWFGPRGLASIVFAVIVLNSDLPGGETIRVTVVSTILLSVIAHGLSANPLVRSLAARLSRARRESTQ